LPHDQTSKKVATRRRDLIDRLNLKEDSTMYALDGYKVFFSAKCARHYEPVVYAGECMSGDPEALYYRILQSRKDEFCIQYFYYWEYQNCMMISHGHDYEPIYIYLKSDNPTPHLIVNAGLARPDCHFHKNEVRPLSGKKDNDTRHITVNLSPYPSYPFGQEGNVIYRGCLKTYPLDTGEDLLFEQNGNRPLFGIRACSNVFSGAEGDLHGPRFKLPLRKLTDRVLDKWYFHHYKNRDDMPFGHDISDPFRSPYIKFHKPSKEEVETVLLRKRGG
jgi:hypothetical protein